MSSTKATQRRLSLLAGSSLAAATIAAAAFTGAVMAPNAALAANECGDPSANGATADTLNCPAGTYPTGIDYSTTTNGDLTVILNDRVNTGTSNTAGTGPILMYGNAGEDMSLIRRDNVGVVGDPRIVNTTGAGRAIDLSTLGDGNILINLTDGDPTAGEPTTPQASAPAPMRITASTDAIRAQALGAGGVTVTIAETGVQSGTSHPKAVITAGGAGGGSGVLATTTSGDIAINTTGATMTLRSGSVAGISATSGTGDIAINSGGIVVFDGGGAGIIAATGGAGTINVSASNVNIRGDTNGIDATTATGDININGSADGITGVGIRARSTGGGDIAVVTGGASGGFFGVAGNGIEATTTGGDIAITTTGSDPSGSSVSGRLRGILATTSGAGDITLNIDGGVSTLQAADSAVIDTSVGAGTTVINLTGGRVAAIESFNPVPSALAIRASSASTSPTMAVNVQNSGSAVYGTVDFSGVTAGGVTFNNSGTGRWEAGGVSVFSAGSDTLIFASELQESFVVGMPQNRVYAGAMIDFGAGNDLVDIQTGLNVGNLSDIGALLDFGAGTDTLNNEGILSIDGSVTFANLETFDNAGVLYLGAGNFLNEWVDFFNGDTEADDILTAPGAVFTGSSLSRVVAAVHLTTVQQEGCDAPTGAGDCLYLPGGTTAGSTLLTLVNAGEPAAQGGFNGAGVTVIDVNGGTSAAGHFALDPNSEGYVVDPVYGPSISRPGLFRYSLRYDAETQRHKIVGLPRSEALEYVVLGSVAQSIWYMTSQAVTDRQTDLREGTEGSVWMKASGEYSKRDVASTVEGFTFDNSYKLYAGSLMAGMDFITGHSGGYDYVLGAQIGYVGSTFDLDASTSSGQFTGATGGVYGSIWDGALFVDGTLNTNFLTLDHDSPGIGSKTTTWLRSVGAQLEGGRRFMLSDKIFAEPLATVAFVNTVFEEISLDGGEVQPADAGSRRAALGLRLGADMFGGPLKVRYHVTGRAWNEFDGDNRGVVSNPGDDLVFGEDVSGGFGEAQAGVSLFNDDQTIAGFLSSGVKFKDGYNAVDLDLGLRLRW